MGRMQSTFQRAGSARFRRAASKLGPGVRTAWGRGDGVWLCAGPKAKGSGIVTYARGWGLEQGEDWVQVG